MGHLQRYFLDADGVKAVNLAAKNIIQYGVNKRLAKIRGDIDTYSQKIKEKAIVDQGNLASDSLPEEQQQLKPPRKRKYAKSLANRRQASQRKRPRRVADNEKGGEKIEGEGDEEDKKGAMKKEKPDEKRESFESVKKGEGSYYRR